MGKAVYTEREKARYVAEWQTSGQSAAGFAVAKGIKETTFYTWSTQAKKRGQSSDSPSFVELPVRAHKFAEEAAAAAGTGRGQYFIRAQGIEAEMGGKALSGDIFVFCNKSRTLLKALWWDKTGFWLCQKRLEKAKWPWPASGERARSISEDELELLLNGIDFFKAHKAVYYQSVG